MNFSDRPKLIKIIEDRKFKDLLRRVGDILQDLIPIGISVTELNHTHFGAALYIQRQLVPDFDEKRPRKDASNMKKDAPWKINLQKKIQKLRAELSVMSSSGPPTKHLALKVGRLKRKYKIEDHQIRAKIAEHQAHIKGLAAQIRNKDKKINQKRINRLFAENPRKVYRELISDTIEVENPPKKEELEQFWRPLYETAKQHQEGPWVQKIEATNAPKPKMMGIRFDSDIVKRKLTQFGNFKTPGIDRIPNFWLKKLDALHPHLADTFDNLVHHQADLPEWLIRGNTSLLPKSQETHLPNKYRPICCLNTTYKLLTGIIADEIYEHLDRGDYLEKEQKGCIRSRFGTKDQLLMNKTILEDARRRHRNLSMAWIDYKKAFDSVPHSWIKRCLDLYKIDDNLRTFLSSQMTQWTTDITLYHNKGEIKIPEVKIKRGIFQGDSLSPLLFCLAIDPLSKLLKSEGIGYSLSKSRKKEEAMKDIVSHLLFMDDLKLYASSDQLLNRLIQTVHKFSNDIHMEFGLDKCAKCSIEAGNKVESGGVQLSDGTEIADLQEDSAYKYLGIEENAQIQHKAMRKKIFEEYVRRVKKICKSELTTKNKITAINQLAIPTVTYGFGIVNWPQHNINNLDIKTRKLLTLHKVIYRNNCLDRLYLPRNEGGMGLIELNTAFRSTIVSLGQYLISHKDPLMKLVANQHKNNLPEHISITKLAKNFGGALIEEHPDDNVPVTVQARTKRLNYSFQERIQRKERWQKHKRAGKFPDELEKPYIDKQASLSWLKKGKLGFDGERIVIGVQDQGLLTNGFKKMAGLSTNDQCRFCHAAVESATHLVSACEVMLGDGHYTKRHNKICSYLHWKVCQAYNIETKPVWEHEPEPVTANDAVTIFYDKPMLPGRYCEGGAIKPDLVVWDREKRTAKIIEVTVPNDFGLNRAERQKLLKYQDLKNALRETWDLDDACIIPVVVGATGLIKTNLKTYLDSIPGSPSMDEVQLAALKGTISIIKRALSHTEL